MRGRPRTFVLTDLEGSTQLWERAPDRMKRAMARHDELVAAAAERNGGRVVAERGEGDSSVTVFARAADGIGFSLDLQRAFGREPWPTGEPLRVRIGVHAGATLDDDIQGPELNRCARVRALAAGGQVLVTDAAADAGRDGLPPGATLRDLGEHRLRGVADAVRVFQLVHPDLADGFAPVPSLSVVPNNLPAALTTFVGRAAELDEVRGALRERRLVSIVGPGGAGKTRLATEAAAAMLDAFGGGVWLAELTRARDPAAVPSAIGAALGVRDPHGPDPWGSIAAAMGSGHHLLVLDNCEHVSDAAADAIARVLATCRGARVLATSREPLGVDGEAILRLAPLPVPPAEADDTATLAEVDAVRLFLDRARLQRRDVALTARTARAIAIVCRRLDGLPLALELAAARARVLTLEEIADRVEDRFALLSQPRRGGPDHQRTLQTSIAWSVDPLDERERALFRRLGVFAGGFTLAAVEAVCAAPPMGDALDTLASLVDRSLVIADVETEPARYRMLETIRAYARADADAAGDASVTADMHLAWIAGLARSGDDAALAGEHPNVDAALAWGFERDPATALRVAIDLTDWWRAYAHPSDGRRWLVAGIERVTDPDLVRSAHVAIARLALAQGDLAAVREHASRALDDDTRVSALTLLGHAAHASGEYDEARTSYERALAEAEAAGNDAVAESLVGSLGNVAHARRDYDAAEGLYRRALDLADDRGDRAGMATATMQLASVAAMRRDYDRARGHIDEALRIAEDEADPPLIAMLRTQLAGIALEQGDLPTARAAAARAIAERTELEDVRGAAIARLYLSEVARLEGAPEEAWALASAARDELTALGAGFAIASADLALGDIAIALERYTDALARYGEAIATFDRIGDPQGIAASLEGIAAACAARGEAERAAVALGAASAAREAVGASAAPSRRAIVEAAERGARVALDPDVFEAARARGAELRLTDVLGAVDA